VARNRKRAKERRARRPQPVANRLERELERTVADIDALPEDAPEPLSHATPDAELAEAQLALGRPDLAEATDETAADSAELADEDANGAAPGATVAAPRAVPGNRLINFLQGSWSELQRVQWPDRRQVMQATGVVIGFVIVAGVFLGVADFFAGKLMNYILTGHFK
jgi:preprotein translocase subunit SecE